MFVDGSCRNTDMIRLYGYILLSYSENVTFTILLVVNVVQDLAKQKMAVYVMPDVCVRQFFDGMHLLNVAVSQ